MDRRESIKNILLGSALAGIAIGSQSCEPDLEETPINLEKPKGYGRTPFEREHDEKIANSPDFFSADELSAIAALCDIILPANDEVGGAIEAKVPDFIAFIVKDLPMHQLPIQGGLMWLNGESHKRFEKAFVALDTAQQLSIIDDIAYPDPKKESTTLEPGRVFFTRIRNLTLTGFYTSKIGIADLGYQGNRANMWDGVPQDVLDKHGLSYEAEWLAKCVNQEKREEIARWDDKGNLLNN